MWRDFVFTPFAVFAIPDIAMTFDELPKEYEPLKAQHAAVIAENIDLKQQLAWFKSQLFGEKSERRPAEAASPDQLHLGEGFEGEKRKEAPRSKVKEHERRSSKKQPLDGEDQSGLRFDDSVPVEEIEIPNPELEGLSEDEYEFFAEKVTHKLGQRPGAYYVIKYVRKAAKLKESGELTVAPPPPSVLEGCFADVTFLVGLIIDKVLYHQPLYRQHQRLKDCGITLSRTTLSTYVHRVGELLLAIFNAQLESALRSKVLAMDELPVKAGRGKKGKMNRGYFWPLYGDKDEVVFVYHPTRAAKWVRETLGEKFEGTLLTDAYQAYERYTKKVQAVHALCWVHLRRAFLKAEKVEPATTAHVIAEIRELYRIEDEIRDKKLTCDKKLAYRKGHSKPIVDRLFVWMKEQAKDKALLPKSPFTKALSYALKREEKFNVFLSDPEVAPDTNHLERQLRGVAMGRRNWLFCSTEIGAKYIGVFNSLILTCRLHDIDPKVYLIDVLQRIDTHPANEIEKLTPRLWKELFAQNPIPAPIEHFRKAAETIEKPLD